MTNSSSRPGGDPSRDQGRSLGQVFGLLAACLGFLFVVGVASAVAEGENSPSPDPIFSLASTEEALDPGSPNVVDTSTTDPEAAENLPHDELNRMEALELIQAVFGATVDGANDAYEALDGAEYHSPNVAVMGADDPQGEGAQIPTLVESTLPLLAENSNGDQTPIDLSLEQVDGELRAANPLVEVGIPSELGDGIVFPEQDVKITLSGAPMERSPSNVDDSTAFYPNVAQDSDLTVVPMPTGVETLTQIRTADAPLTQTFDLTLPADAALSETDQGGAIVKRNGQLLMSVTPPAAQDATGEEVPVTLEVLGDSVNLHVEPEGAVFPILVDPVFETYDWPKYYGAEGHNYNFAMPDWTAATTTASYGAQNWTVGEFAGHWGMVLNSGWPGGTVVPGSQATWNYHVPKFFSDYDSYTPHIRPTTFIDGVKLQELEFRFSSLNGAPPSRQGSPYFIGGIWDSIYGGWIAPATRTGIDGQLTDPTKIYPFENKNHDENAKNFGMALQSNEYNANAERQLWAGKATVELSDPDNPTIDKKENPNQWVDGQPTAKVVFSTTDLGLGVHRLTVEQPTIAGPPATVETKQGCTGGASKPCPRYWKDTSAGMPPLAYNPSVMPQGEHWTKFNAYDPIGHKTGESGELQSEIKFKVDHTDPTFHFSGSMAEQATVGISAAQYILKYSANDGDSAAPSASPSFGGPGTGYGETERPTGVAVDSAGRIFVLDRGNNRVLVFDTNEKFSFQFGSTGSGNGQLLEPRGIAIAPNGNIWVADSGNARVQKFTPYGSYAGQFGSKGTAGGKQFQLPYGIAIGTRNGAAVVYVSDQVGNRVGAFLESGSFLGNVSGTPSNAGAPADFIEPQGLALDAANSLLVADGGHNRIQRFNSDGKFLFQFGDTGVPEDQLKDPIAVAVAPSGHILVTSSLNSRIQNFQPNGTLLRKFGAAGSGSGQFMEPRGIAVGANNTVFVADAGNHRVVPWAHTDYDPQSGVTKVEMKVDSETPKVLYDQACTTKDCAKAGEWIYTANDYPTGQHSVVMTATDGVNRTTSKSLTFNSINDTTPPQIIANSGFFAAPEGWVEQKSYSYSALTKDPGGRGPTSFVFKIDGNVVNSLSQPCSTGGCMRGLTGTLNMATYKGGAHPAELIATDGGGLTTKKQWTINVAPKGDVQAVEAEKTLEALEDTSPVNLIGEAKSETEYEGTAEDLEVELASGELFATGGAVPTVFDANPGASVTVHALNADYLGGNCLSQSSEETPPEATPAEREKQAPDATPGNCTPAPSSGATEEARVPITITPVVVSPAAGETDVSNGDAAVLSTNVVPHVDIIARPLYDGAMTYAAIRDAAATETYSWTVELDIDQELKLIDSKHVTVYEEGRPAFGITAAPARDAVGTSVPTNLSVSEGNVVTLTVAHRGLDAKGNRFIYPVMGGTGWEGGFQSFPVEMPPTEPMPEEVVEVEGVQVVEEANVTRVRVNTVGPPVLLSATAGNTPPRRFVFSECRYSNYRHLPQVPYPASKREYLAAIAGSCMREEDSATAQAGTAVRGWFHYIQGDWVWVNPTPANQLECVKWGSAKPAMVDCQVKPAKAKEGITVRGFYRYPVGATGTIGNSLCVVLYGTLHSTAPHKQVHESLFQLKGGNENFEPCQWPA